MNQLPATHWQFDLVQGQLWLTVQPDAHIATLHFAVGQSKNAISPLLAAALCTVCDWLSGAESNHPVAQLVNEKSLLVLVLRSHCSNVFLSGGNLKDIVQMTRQEGELFTQRMRTFTELLRSGPLVSIALLNGSAIGGGSEIALACDLRLSTSTSASIQFAQTAWGVPSGWGGMTDLTRKNIFHSERRRGISFAAQENLNIDTLVRLQLIDHQCENAKDPLAQADAWVGSFALRLAACPASLRTQLIHERPSLTSDSLDAFDRALFEQYWLSEEHLQRVSSRFSNRSEPRNQRED
jgi:enoyl-CoA hydratase/carnithine racemase